MSQTFESSTPAPPGAQTAADAAVEAAHTPARGVLVGFIIFALVVSTLGMTAFIWYRWAGVREPTTAVIIKGDPSLDGTLITVLGTDRVVTATLSAENKYEVPILVDPGVYTVRAQHDGLLLMNKDVEVKRFFGVIYDLTEYVRRAREQGKLPPASATPETVPSQTPGNVGAPS